MMTFSRHECCIVSIEEEKEKSNHEKEQLTAIKQGSLLLLVLIALLFLHHIEWNLAFKEYFHHLQHSIIFTNCFFSKSFGKKHVLRADRATIQNMMNELNQRACWGSGRGFRVCNSTHQTNRSRKLTKNNELLTTYFVFLQKSVFFLPRDRCKTHRL